MLICCLRQVPQGPQPGCAVAYSWLSSVVYSKIIPGLSLKRFSDLAVSSLIMSPNYFQKASVCLLSSMYQQNRANQPLLVSSEGTALPRPPRPDVCGALRPHLLSDLDLEQAVSPQSPQFLLCCLDAPTAVSGVQGARDPCVGEDPVWKRLQTGRHSASKGPLIVGGHPSCLRPAVSWGILPMLNEGVRVQGAP